MIKTPHLIALVFPEIADGEDKSSPLKNCIRNNYRHIRKWAKRTGTNCFRLYDRDMREFPLAIDYYDGKFCIHYFAKNRDSDAPPEELLKEAEGALTALFKATPDLIYWRTRIKREKRQQYEKAGATNEFFTVYEYGVRFNVNLHDYLDTGLFLDHRETRQLVAAACKKKRLLNLFAYTCSFSVHAAHQGASYTKSVDMSHTYTDWGKENFKTNTLSLLNHEVVCADCMKFLVDEVRKKIKYDVIVIDPPTISRSKKMETMFDVQIDYIFLIEQALLLLHKGGVIFFSTNSRHFVFDSSRFPDCLVTDISHKTLPLDFHDPKIHHCWTVVKTNA